MKIDKKDIEKLAHLSRLELSDKEMEKYSEQISLVLDYFEKLDDAKTEGVEPLDFVTEMKNVWRADEACVFNSREKLMAEAPDLEGDSFGVPKVLASKKE